MYRCTIGNIKLVNVTQTEGRTKKMKNESSVVETTIGGRIRSLREKMGMTQQELAAAVLASREKIVKIEGGKRDVQAEDIPAFATALGTNCDYLLTGNDKCNTRLVGDLGLTNDVIEKLAELTVLRNSSDHILKTGDDCRHYEIAKRAQESLTAINFLLSNDESFSIIKLIYAYSKMNFSSAMRITSSKDEKGQSIEALHWSDEVDKLSFFTAGGDESSSMVFPVSLMENCCLDEIKNSVQTMKRRSEK